MSRITTSIDIAAPVEAVWRVLMDWPRYPEWNPMLRAITGKQRVGARITVSTASPVGTVEIPAVITRFVQRSSITWHARLPLSGLFDRDHLIDLTATPTGTRLTQTQVFAGMLAAPASVFATGVVRSGLDAMNRALKARLEGPAQEMPVSPPTPGGAA